ncbi:Uncharacterised protein [Yersinia nurmii]|uniref:Uncharacterized protein n=1 Tax=Yersinia nurmii TaxID=685706 RepID=A0ABP1YJI6_9GAMM|nr:Uncharacterised protein [Yersinia nurmii]
MGAVANFDRKTTPTESDLLPKNRRINRHDDGISPLNTLEKKKAPRGAFKQFQTERYYSTSTAFSSLNASSRRVIIEVWAARSHTRGS